MYSYEQVYPLNKRYQYNIYIIIVCFPDGQLIEYKYSEFGSICPFTAVYTPIDRLSENYNDVRHSNDQNQPTPINR